MPLAMMAQQSPSSGSYGGCTEAACIVDFSSDLTKYCDEKIKLIVTTSTGTPVTVNAITLTGPITQTVSGNTIPTGLPPGSYLVTYSVEGGCEPQQIKIEIPTCCIPCDTREFLASILTNTIYDNGEICIVDEFNLPYSGQVSNDGGLTKLDLVNGCAIIQLDGNNSITFYPSSKAENTCNEPSTCQPICLTF